MKTFLRRIELRALLATLVFCSPALYERVKFGSLSPRLFTDWDEALYLTLALGFGKFSIIDAIQGDPQTISQMSMLNWVTYPHNLVDLVVGAIGQYFKLSATDLGLLFDLICFYLSYLIFTKVFLLINNKQGLAEASTLGLLCFPWLFSRTISLDIPLSFLPYALPVQTHTFPSLPVQRALYTQLSYPIFGLSLFYLFRGIQGKQLALAISGMFSGLLFCFYFFSWGATISLSFFFLLINHFSSGNKQLKELIKNLAIYGGSAFITSLPAFYLIFKWNTLQAVVFPNEMTRYWFFRLDYFIVVVLFIGLSRYLKQKSAFSIPCQLIASCLLAHFVLMNAQPVLQRLITPYHFMVFYLDPVLSGCLLVIVLNLFSSEKLKQIVILSLAIGALSLPMAKYLNSNFTGKERSRFLELAEAILSETAEHDIIAVSKELVSPKGPMPSFAPYTRILPFQIAAVTKRTVFPVNADFQKDDLIVEQSLASRYLFFGTTESIPNCKAYKLNLPGDVLSGVTTWVSWKYSQFCDLENKIRLSFSPCAYLATLPLAYVVWEKEFNIEKPQWLTQVGKQVWVSSDKSYELIEIELDNLFKFNCP